MSAPHSSIVHLQEVLLKGCDRTCWSNRCTDVKPSFIHLIPEQPEGRRGHDQENRCSRLCQVLTSSFGAIRETMCQDGRLGVKLLLEASEQSEPLKEPHSTD